MSTAVGGRPISRRSRLRGGVLAALVLRDWLIARSYRLSFAFDTVFGVLNLAVFFYISRTFTGVGTARLGGAPSYFAFAAVGVSLGLVIQASSAGIADRLRDEQVAGTLEALVVQPLSAAELCLGLVGFPFAFALIRAIGYLLVAAVLMGLDLSHASWVGLAAVLVASGLAFSALGILSGAAVLVVKRGAILVGTAIFGMSVISGSVFPRDVLPPWLEWVGGLMPTRFSFDGVRGALFGHGGWRFDAMTLALFGVVSIPVAVWIFARALRHARRAGTLAQY